MLKCEYRSHFSYRFCLQRFLQPQGRSLHRAPWAMGEWASRTGGHGDGRGRDLGPSIRARLPGWPRVLLYSWEGLLRSVAGQRRLIRVLGIRLAALPAWLVGVASVCAPPKPCNVRPGGEALCFGLMRREVGSFLAVRWTMLMARDPRMFKRMRLRWKEGDVALEVTKTEVCTLEYQTRASGGMQSG